MIIVFGAATVEQFRCCSDGLLTIEQESSNGGRLNYRPTSDAAIQPRSATTGTATAPESCIRELVAFAINTSPNGIGYRSFGLRRTSASADHKRHEATSRRYYSLGRGTHILPYCLALQRDYVMSREIEHCCTLARYWTTHAGRSKFDCVTNFVDYGSCFSLTLLRSSLYIIWNLSRQNKKQQTPTDFLWGGQPRKIALPLEGSPLPCITWFFWPTRPSLPNGISIGSTVFA